MSSVDVGEQRLGFCLLEWHGGGGTAVYAVGSHLFAGHVPPDRYVIDAIGELLRLHQDAKHPECVTVSDVQECGRLAKRLVSFATKQNVLAIEGVRNEVD